MNVLNFRKILFAATLLLIFPVPVFATNPPLTITSVAINNSSAKIVFQPVAGAKDYRVYDITSPTNVKYAGLRHIDLTTPPLGWQGTYKLVMQANGLPQVPLTFSASATGPQILDFPSPELEWNNLGDRNPHTLIVEAVDALGPVPYANLYDVSNAPLVNPLPNGAMLGSNKGLTPDGKISTNGQGPYTNNPQVIAQSNPFVVQASSTIVPVPATADATQTFLDTFDQNEAGSILQTSYDPNQDLMSFTMNAGTPKAWSLLYTHTDVKDSMPFIASDHFMDMLFDAGTPGTNNPLHQGHGEMGMTPNQTVDFSAGKMLHITQEVDGHVSGRRWLSIALSPANDPFISFDPQSTAGFNNSDKSVFLQFFPGMVTLDISTGPTSVTDNTPLNNRLWGAAGQAPISGYDSSNLGGNGIAFDNRSRYDFFITQTHAAFFKDGVLIQDSDISGGMPFTQAKVYFIHYIYHSDQEENTGERDLLVGSMCYPMNSYWYNDPVSGIPVGNGPNQTSCGIAYPPGFGFRYSDERHWDNMGFEVFPSSDVPVNNAWNTLASTLIKIPQPQPPNFVSNITHPDVNSDGVVNALDFAEVFANLGWTGTIGSNTADVNGDGQINILDIQAVLSAWL